MQAAKKRRERKKMGKQVFSPNSLLSPPGGGNGDENSLLVPIICKAFIITFSSLRSSLGIAPPPKVTIIFP